MGGMSQNLSHQTSDPTVVYPFGGSLPTQTAGRFNNQFARPFAQAFAFNSRPGFEKKLAAGAASGNPMATYLTQSRDLVNQQIPQAQQLGTEISDRARSGYGDYEQSVNDFMAQLPGFQNQIGADRAQAGKDFQSGRNSLSDASSTIRDAIANLAPARSALGEGMDTTRTGVNALGTAGQTLDQTGRELDTATGYGQRSAEQAFSPLQGRALFQEAAARAQNALGGQQALTGMVGQGGGGAAQQDMLTNMALQAMQNEGTNQREATSLLGELAGRRTSLGTAETGLGSAYGNIGAQQGELGSRYGELASREGELGGRQTDVGQAYGNIGAQYGDTMTHMTDLASRIAQMGPEQMQQLFQSQPQLAAALITGQQLPMQTAGQLQSFLSGQFKPTFDLAELTKPQVGQKSKGTSGGQSVSVGSKGGGGG